MYSKREALFALGCLTIPLRARAQFSGAKLNPLYITIIRDNNLATVLNLNDCITGKLYIGKDIYDFPHNAIAAGSFCDTLELPYRNNLNDISACPVGFYTGTVRTTVSSSGANLGWRINLADTEPRLGVQIHIGNSPSEISGCILIGKKGPSPAGKSCWVGSSAVVRNALQFLYADPTNSRKISIHIA